MQNTLQSNIQGYRSHRRVMLCISEHDLYLRDILMSEAT